MLTLMHSGVAVGDFLIPQSLATFDYEGGVPETAASEFRTQVLEQGNVSSLVPFQFL